MPEAVTILTYPSETVIGGPASQIRLTSVTVGGGGSGVGGNGINLTGAVQVYAGLPDSLALADSGQAWLVTSSGLIYVWNGSSWPAEGAGISLQGPEGPMGNIQFAGHGTPGTIIGSSPGNSYVDWDTGIIYTLS